MYFLHTQIPRLIIVLVLVAVFIKIDVLRVRQEVWTRLPLCMAALQAPENQKKREANQLSYGTYLS
jgi:hypothetical protein